MLGGIVSSQPISAIPSPIRRPLTIESAQLIPVAASASSHAPAQGITVRGTQMHTPHQPLVQPLFSIGPSSSNPSKSRLPLSVSETPEEFLLPINSHFTAAETNQIFKSLMGNSITSSTNPPLTSQRASFTAAVESNKPRSTTPAVALPTATQAASLSNTQNRVHPSMNTLPSPSPARHTPRDLDFSALKRLIDDRVESGEIDANLTAYEKSRKYIEIMNRKFQEEQAQANDPLASQFPYLDAFLENEAKKREVAKQKERIEKLQTSIQQKQTGLAQREKQRKLSIQRVDQTHELEKKNYLLVDKIGRLEDEYYRSHLPTPTVSRDLYNEDEIEEERLQLQVIKRSHQVADSRNPNEEAAKNASLQEAIQELDEFRSKPTMLENLRDIPEVWMPIVKDVDEEMEQQMQEQIRVAEEINLIQLSQLDIVEAISREQQPDQIDPLKEQLSSAQAELESDEWKQQEEAFSHRFYDKYLQALKCKTDAKEAIDVRMEEVIGRLQREEQQQAEEEIEQVNDKLSEQRERQSKQQEEDQRNAEEEENTSSIAIHVKNARKRKSNPQQKNAPASGTRRKLSFDDINDREQETSKKRSHKRKQPTPVSIVQRPERPRKSAKLELTSRNASRTAFSAEDEDTIESGDDDFDLEPTHEQDDNPQAIKKKLMNRSAKAKPGYILPISLISTTPTTSKAKQQFIHRQQQLQSQIFEESIEDEEMNTIIDEDDMIQMD